MSAVAWLLNTGWMLKCGPEAKRFANACRNVADAQLEILRQTLHANKDTEFGRLHGFREISSARAYQERVPVATYNDLAPLIRRIAAGEAGVLTAEPVRLLEPTSGTTGGEKLIPYTAGLRHQFQRGIAVWIADLFRRRPKVREGRAYWSISPMLGPPRRSAGGLPIGFDDDAAYLGWAERFALRGLLVTPPEIAGVSGMEGFRYGTLLSLLAAEDLALISVWSPTFLTALLAPLESWQERLGQDLRRGTFSPPTALDDKSSRRFARRLRAEVGRGDRVVALLRAPVPWHVKLRSLWPKLALISCWTDAAAGQFLLELRSLFPDIEFQPKGLLATEGFVSLPIVDQPGAVLAVRSHFFEFEELGGQARCRLAHELDHSGRYRVNLTTAGGLYRYALRDEVEVVGFYGQCPMLRFLGKSDGISDLVGEKLAEPHVRMVLERLCEALALRPRFCLLVPILDQPARYRLYIQTPEMTGKCALLDRLREGLEAGLNENPYYHHACASGQLAPVQIELLDPAGDSAWKLYERRCMELGARCGNIKPAVLDRRTDWPAIFASLQVEYASDRK